MPVYEKINADGSTNYIAEINHKKERTKKTFFCKEDANLYLFYRSKLLQNMEKFDVPLKQRVRLSDVIDLKIQSKETNQKELNSFKHCSIVFDDKLGKNKFLHEITYEDWLKAAKEIYNEPVYRGAKKEKNKRMMSPITLKRQLAYASSSISYAKSLGIELENHPLMVIQTFVDPMIKNSKNSEIETSDGENEEMEV